MKSTELLALLIKLCAIVLFLGTLQSAFGIVLYIFPLDFGDAGFLITTLLTLAPLFLGFALALLFWTFPVSTAKWFLPTSNDQSYPDINWDLENLELVLFSAIGVYLAATSFPDFVYNIAYLILYWGDTASLYDEDWNRNYTIMDTLYATANLTIGILLAVFNGNIRKLLTAFRKSKA